MRVWLSFTAAENAQKCSVGKFTSSQRKSSISQNTKFDKYDQKRYKRCLETQNGGVFKKSTKFNMHKIQKTQKCKTQCSVPTAPPRRDNLWSTEFLLCRLGAAAASAAKGQKKTILSLQMCKSSS